MMQNGLNREKKTEKRKLKVLGGWGGEGGEDIEGGHGRTLRESEYDQNTVI